MMLLLFCFTGLMLCSHALHSTMTPKNCSRTEYPWPINKPVSCCKKCPPGQRMVTRPDSSCRIICEPCKGNQYKDSYNVDMRCLFCTDCDEETMLTKSRCNATHNTVCTCKAGYRCKNEACTACEPIPSTTLPPSTTALTPTTPTPEKAPIRDTVWFLVIIALLCSGIALVMVTKIKPFLQWTRSIYGYFLTEKQEYTEDHDLEDNDMPTPVQEVCGKCDQPIEV